MMFFFYLTMKVVAEPVESKTLTFHGRVGLEHPAKPPGGVGTKLFAQETNVPRTYQCIEETAFQRLCRSTKKRNLM